MKRIDSSTDVALTQYEGGPEDTTREIILKVAGELFPPVPGELLFRRIQGV
jgi:hypothetical protein